MSENRLGHRAAPGVRLLHDMSHDAISMRCDVKRQSPMPKSVTGVTSALNPPMGYRLADKLQLRSTQESADRGSADKRSWRILVRSRLSLADRYDQWADAHQTMAEFILAYMDCFPSDSQERQREHSSKLTEEAAQLRARAAEFRANSSRKKSPGKSRTRNKSCPVALHQSQDAPSIQLIQ
jgi:hypothetical protein